MRKVLDEILIRTKRRLFGPDFGRNMSAFAGNGLDFSELKEYAYGDDVRRINWKVTAREQQPFVNVFHEERELNIVVGCMMGGSIYFGSKRQKQEAMAEVLALLGFAALFNDDRVSAIFYDHDLIRWFAPTRSPHTVESALSFALETEVLGRRSDLQAFADFLLHAVKRRSIVIVLGDFYEAADLSLLAARHELYTVVVRDRFEEDPPLDGLWELVDPQTLARHTVQTGRAGRTAWREWLRSHDARFASQCARHRIGHTKIYTDEDPYPKLRELLR